MIKGIAHTAYTVENMEKSLDFYCNVIGFEKVFELARPNGEPWIIYLKVSNDQFVELFYGGAQKSAWNNDVIGYNHLCLEVDDIHDIANKIKAKGVKMDVEPKQGVDLNWQCWVRDPDGNRIEMMQMDPESPQMKALRK